MRTRARKFGSSEQKAAAIRIGILRVDNSSICVTFRVRVSIVAVKLFQHARFCCEAGDGPCEDSPEASIAKLKSEGIGDSPRHEASSGNRCAPRVSRSYCFANERRRIHSETKLRFMRISRRAPRPARHRPTCYLHLNDMTFFVRTTTSPMNSWHVSDASITYVRIRI